MAITDYQLSEIQRKAKAGIQMDNPTAEKSAIYNSYLPKPAAVASVVPAFDQNAYLKTQQDQVNSIYDNQTAARTAQFNAQRDKALGLVNQQKAEVAPQYANKRNQADVVNAQNVNRLREMMAANGISASGENVTANVALGSARQGALSQLNLQEQQTNNEFDRQITNINDPSELNAVMAEIASQRSLALNDASNRANEMGYSRSRDAENDRRYNAETIYNQGRDSINDGRYQDENVYNRGQDSKQWDYQSGRDSINDGRYTNETQYERALQLAEDKRRAEQLIYDRKQDALVNSRRGSSGGGGSGGSSSYGASAYAPQTKLPAKPTPARIMTEKQYIDAYEQSNARKNGTARVIPGSTDYANKMKKVMSDLYK